MRDRKKLSEREYNREIKREGGVVGSEILKLRRRQKQRKNKRVRNEKEGGRK